MHRQTPGSTARVLAGLSLLIGVVVAFGYLGEQKRSQEDWDETRAILDCYHRAILFHVEVPLMQAKEKDYQKYLDTLVELEGEMFKDQYYRAFLFLAGPCRQCKKCGAVEGKPCASPWKARPSLEGCGIDVYQTARNNGFFGRSGRSYNSGY